MKKQRLSSINPEPYNNLFDNLTEELIFTILDKLPDKKPFSIVSKQFHSIESHHRRTLTPLRIDHLPKILTRYPNTTDLNLTLCPRVTDTSLATISNSANLKLKSIDLSRSRFFTHLGLEMLTRRCWGSLVEINLTNAVEIGDSGAKAVAEAGNLERLWLGRCRSVSDIGIGCIAVGCRRLRVVGLKWCVGVGDLGVGLMAIKCRDIRSFDLSHVPITGKCVPAILQLPHLEDLVLEGCFGIDDDDLAALKLGCKTLKALDVSNCQNITPVGLASITSNSKSLQQLTMSYGAPVTRALADSLQQISSLQSIKLDGCLVTCSGLKAIGNWCGSLRELSLSKCSGVTDEGLSSVVIRHKDLRKLDITCCRKITYVSIDVITNSCRNLTSLRMESCTLIPKEAFVLIGKRCWFLEELDLTDNEIDNEGLKSISKSSKLSTLKLGICLDISDEGLSHIAMCCSKLIELDLYRCAGVTDKGILAISRRCTNLEMINVAYCGEITDSSLVSLSKCLKLNTFESRGCPLITSIGLAAIAMGCRQLTKLDIKKCYNIDDTGMISLAHFSQNLRQINLSYSSVTDVGVLSLASISCLQSMTILHLKGLSPSGLAAALLACGGLTKIKLQTSFKSLLPRPLCDHLEARGCLFQWSDKVFRDELDPKCWKLQLEGLQ